MRLSGSLLVKRVVVLLTNEVWQHRRNGRKSREFVFILFRLCQEGW